MHSVEAHTRPPFYRIPWIRRKRCRDRPPLNASRSAGNQHGPPLAETISVEGTVMDELIGTRSISLVRRSCPGKVRHAGLVRKARSTSRCMGEHARTKAALPLRAAEIPKPAFRVSYRSDRSALTKLHPPRVCFSPPALLIKMGGLASCTLWIEIAKDHDRAQSGLPNDGQQPKPPRRLTVAGPR